MLAGLSLSAWVLFVVAVGLGLVIELGFYVIHRRAARRSVRSIDPPGSF